MIVTLLEIAGSLPGNTGSKAIVGFTNMGSNRSLHMDPSPPTVITKSSSEGLVPDAPLRPAAEGMEELDRVYSWTLWSSF